MDIHFAKIKGDTWNEKLQSLIACKCCIRHNTNKPQHLETWIDTQFHYTNFNPDKCTCPCRHNARFICRMFNNTVCPKYSEWKNSENILSSGYLTD